MVKAVPKIGGHLHDVVSVDFSHSVGGLYKLNAVVTHSLQAPGSNKP
jgi:hypothetical protein